MADPNFSAPQDEVLTAYLDGELPAEEKRAIEATLASDPSSKARLDALAKSSRPYKDAFALVLDAAPRERLTAMLKDVAPPADVAPPRRVWLAASAVVLFAAGISLGIASRPSAPPAAPVVAEAQPAPTNWRQVVAEYLVLTTPATLAAMPDNPSLGQAVAAYAPKLKLDVSTDNLMLPSADLKDVALYDYRGKPLVEAAYLSSDQMMVAFCIILNGQPDAPIAFEQREGKNIVFWTEGGHGFMVVGTAPRDQLEALARDLATRFS